MAEFRSVPRRFALICLCTWIIWSSSGCRGLHETSLESLDCSTWVKQSDERQYQVARDLLKDFRKAETAASGFQVSQFQDAISQSCADSTGDSKRDRIQEVAEVVYRHSPDFFAPLPARPVATSLNCNQLPLAGQESLEFTIESCFKISTEPPMFLVGSSFKADAAQGVLVTWDEQGIRTYPTPSKGGQVEIIRADPRIVCFRTGEQLGAFHLDTRAFVDPSVAQKECR